MHYLSASSSIETPNSGINNTVSISVNLGNGINLNVSIATNLGSGNNFGASTFADL
jgi:hypothetical protein